MRWGLIGASNIAGEWMVGALRAIGDEPVAVVSGSLGRARDFARQHGIAHALAGEEGLDALGIDAWFHDIGLADGYFLCGWFTGKGGEVDFADALGVGHLGFHQQICTTSAGAELHFDVARVHEVQALGETGGGDAFAFADAGVVGSAEDFEEGGGAGVAVVGQ